MKARNQKRLDEVVKLRKRGLKFREIAQRMGVTTSYANALYLRALRRLNRQPHWTDPLGVRLGNTLLNLNIQNKEEAMNAYLNRTLYPGKIRHYGVKCHQEIAKWLGMPKP